MMAPKELKTLLENYLEKLENVLTNYKVASLTASALAIYLASTYRHDAVEGDSKVLLFVSMRRPKHHHSILDGRAVQVIQADCLWAGQRQRVHRGR